MFPPTAFNQKTLGDGGIAVINFRILAAATVIGLALGAANPASAFIEEHLERVMNAVAAGEPVTCDNCNLSYADLSELDLSGASLNGAYLYGAKLQRTILRDATLNRTDFTRSDLEGADLTGATMSEIRSVSTKWCGTTMPDGSTNDSRC
jgi:uncharacterized protein YjbI with pentapeptide repeats